MTEMLIAEGQVLLGLDDDGVGHLRLNRPQASNGMDVPFLRALYDRCTRAGDIHPIRIGAFLEQHPPRDTLPHLFAGSWIHHDFAIWIGHEDVHAAEPAVHQRAAGPHRDFPERQIHAFGGKGFVDEIVFADRCAARGDENIRREVAGLANGGDGRFEPVGHQAEIGDERALPARALSTSHRATMFSLVT